MGLIRDVAGAAIAGPVGAAAAGADKKKRSSGPSELGESPGGESLDRAEAGPPESPFAAAAKRAGQAALRGLSSRNKRR